MKLKKQPLKKEFPKIPLIDDHPCFKHVNAQSFFSFRANKETLDYLGSEAQGCHAFVKSLKFGEKSNMTLGILIEEDFMFFDLEDIKKYIEILNKIGFNITFHGSFEKSDLLSTYRGFLNSITLAHYTNKTKFLYFTLGENYKNNVASIRYIALCYLRFLWTSERVWFPKTLNILYDYFKKKRIKPTLSKILLFAESCPGEIFYKNLTLYRISRNFNISSKEDQIISLKKYLKNGAYGFVGYSSFSPIDNTKINYHDLMFSTLLAMPDNFNIIEYLENWNTVYKYSTGSYLSLSLYTQDYGRTKIIQNDCTEIYNTINELFEQREYHKAYLYLKKIVLKFVEIKGECIVDFTVKKEPILSTTDVVTNKESYVVNRQEKVTLTHDEFNQLIKIK